MPARHDKGRPSELIDGGDVLESEGRRAGRACAGGGTEDRVKDIAGSGGGGGVGGERERLRDLGARVQLMGVDGEIVEV